MLGSFHYIARACVFTDMLEVPQRLLFAMGSRASLDVDLKENTVEVVAFELLDFLCGSGDGLEIVDRHPFAAVLCHFQVPHGFTSVAGDLAGKGVEGNPREIPRLVSL
jgi:hypothetical protein